MFQILIRGSRILVGFLILAFGCTQLLQAAENDSGSILVLPLQTASTSLDEELLSGLAAQNMIENVFALHNTVDVLPFNDSLADLFSSRKAFEEWIKHGATLPDSTQKTNARYALNGQIIRNGRMFSVKLKLLDLRRNVHFTKVTVLDPPQFVQFRKSVISLMSLAGIPPSAEQEKKMLWPENLPYSGWIQLGKVAYEYSLLTYESDRSIGSDILKDSPDAAPDSYLLRNLLARLCYKIQQYSEAKKFFEQALTLNSNGADSADGLMSVNEELEDSRQVELWSKKKAEILGRKEVKEEDTPTDPVQQTQQHNPNDAVTLRKAIEDARQAGDFRTLVEATVNMSILERDAGQTDQAIAELNKALETSQSHVPEKQTVICNLLGRYNDELTNYNEALQYLNRALDFAKRYHQPGGVILSDTAYVYKHLGDFRHSQEYYQNALEKALDSHSPHDQIVAYLGLGDVARAQKDTTAALAAYHSAEKLATESGDDLKNGAIPNVLGMVYYATGDYSQAEKSFQQSLEYNRKTGFRFGEAYALNGLGMTYISTNQTQKAIEMLHQSLLIWHELNLPSREARTCSNLMLAYRLSGNSGTAIFYGKMGINIWQEIRGKNKEANKELQDLLVKSQESNYRELADLLFEQGRLVEAQQVLNLLKQEEYFDFLNPEEVQTKNKAQLTDNEKSLEKRYVQIADRVTQIGAERRALRQKLSRTEAEEKRLRFLEGDLKIASGVFHSYLDQLEASSEKTDKLYELRESQALMPDLAELGQGTVALFTIVGEDKYRLILVTSDVPQAFEYPISAQELKKKIFAFRCLLQNPDYDPRPAAKELFDILIGPAARALDGAGAQTLMWSLDGVLRYLPVQALYDGKQYLLERYRSVVFTLGSRARLKETPQADWRILGFGVSKHIPGFSELPGVKDELSQIIRDPNKQSQGILPGVIKLNEEFTRQTLEQALAQHFPVVHIASHFVFKPGSKSDSFLLLGNGEKLSLQDIENSTDLFEGVDLLTLSACDTASGNEKGADGKEVEGFGVLAQGQGAKAVIATLWPVADESTRMLMYSFYNMRKNNPGISKAEALRQAQLTLLHGEKASASPPIKRGESKAPADCTQNSSLYYLDPLTPFAHPYYWAPFILIGNWK